MTGHGCGKVRYCSRVFGMGRSEKPAYSLSMFHVSLGGHGYTPFFFLFFLFFFFFLETNGLG